MRNILEACDSKYGKRSADSIRESRRKRACVRDGDHGEERWSEFEARCSSVTRITREMVDSRTADGCSESLMIQFVGRQSALSQELSIDGSQSGERDEICEGADL